MSEALKGVSEARIQELLDRQDIADCVTRYCRAVDRFDRELMRSVYHDDAFDNHGSFSGGRDGFIDWAFAYHQEHQLSHHHMIFNHSVELDGNQAHAETYWLFFGENRVKPDTLAVGRYIDRFEKRDGRWAIAERVCVTESVNQIEAVDLPPTFRAVQMGNAHSSRDRGDVSYQRPLRARQGNG
ncbi:putative lumazine-binding protein [compost metagenome]